MPPHTPLAGHVRAQRTGGHALDARRCSPTPAGGPRCGRSWAPHLVAALLALIVGGSFDGGPALATARPSGRLAAEDGHIRPHPAAPHYWEYRGRPVLLLGGTVEDNLFQLPDLEAHLDQLAAAGGNYVRNTLSSRDPGNVWPFARAADGRYDLHRFDDEYFARLTRLLTLTQARGIIVQIEVWDRFDYALEYWKANPFNPANTGTYTAEASGLRTDYPDHPSQNVNPFFRTVPGLANHAVLLPIQQALVDRVLATTLGFDHVLYCIDNETNGDPTWGAYWADRIRARAGEAGREVHVTEMWDAWDLNDPMHRHTLDHPERYTFVDVSQNNHQKGQLHWDRLQQLRARLAPRPRPVNNVKIYGADTGRYGSSRDGAERFWRNVVGGAASARFHRPASGLGLTPEAQAHMRSARLVADAFPFARAEPDAASAGLADRAANEAYLTKAGSTQLVYFPDGGSVRLTAPPAGARARWLEVAASRWHEPSAIPTGELVAPGPGHWVAIVEPGGA